MKRILPWVAAAALTLVCFAFQNRTGPTYPLEGKLATARGEVAYKFLRSEEIGTGLQIMLREPVPAGVSAKVRYRRYKSNDGWSETPMAPGNLPLLPAGSGGGGPGHRRHAALAPGAGRQVRVPGARRRRDGVPARSPATAPCTRATRRPVPRAVLLVHILLVFLSMTLAIRTGLQAITGGELRGPGLGHHRLAPPGGLRARPHRPEVRLRGLLVGMALRLRLDRQQGAGGARRLARRRAGRVPFPEPRARPARPSSSPPP